MESGAKIQAMYKVSIIRKSEDAKCKAYFKICEFPNSSQSRIMLY